MNTQNKSDARVKRPERFQVEMQFYALDELLAKDHHARLVWQYVESLDLSPLYIKFEVTANTSGRSGISPEILFALWMLATIDGIGSAREIDRRCDTDLPYRWICGGVGVNYHTLSDFRTENVEFLEQLMIDSVSLLIDQGLLPLDTIAQDGMRVRANAGKSSFRRKPSLKDLQKEARTHLDDLKRQSEDESARQKSDAKKKAAEERAAKERLERINEALRQHEALSKKRQKKTTDNEAQADAEETVENKTRVSTTDPDARVMKMANGGFDPAFNVQFATDADTRIIVSVEVLNTGSDRGQLAPILANVSSDYHKQPKNILVDSAYATKNDVTAAEQAGTKVVSTIPRREQLKRSGKDPHSRQSGDTDEYVAFRARMAEDEYKDLYRQRPSVAEFPNAVCRNRGLRQFPVRGLAKVKAVALWHALAFNFTRMLHLGMETA